MAVHMTFMLVFAVPDNCRSTFRSNVAELVTTEASISSVP